MKRHKINFILWC